MKRHFAWLCLLILLAAACSHATAAAAGPLLAIDTIHVYEGMEKSYAEGYLPVVSKDQALVVLPLLAPTAAGSLTVTANLGDPAHTPFVYQNYEKQFASNSYTFEDEQVNCFLLHFALPLKTERLNGTYPIILTVKGKTVDEETFTEDYTLYLTITDGINPQSPAPEPAPAPLLAQINSESYALAKDYLEAGETAELKITLRNTSNSQSAKILNFPCR